MSLNTTRPTVTLFDSNGNAVLVELSADGSYALVVKNPENVLIVDLLQSIVTLLTEIRDNQ